MPAREECGAASEPHPMGSEEVDLGEAKAAYPVPPVLPDRDVGVILLAEIGDAKADGKADAEVEQGVEERGHSITFDVVKRVPFMFDVVRVEPGNGMLGRDVAHRLERAAAVLVALLPEVEAVGA